MTLRREQQRGKSWPQRNKSIARTKVLNMALCGKGSEKNKGTTRPGLDGSAGSPEALTLARGCCRGSADFGEGHGLTFLAGEYALQRPRTGMYANGRVVSIDYILQLVTWLDT